MLETSSIYTSYGANRLYGCWAEGVSKHDASSFYNWEADNLPLYDLEERTNLLYERFGAPLSSLTGYAFIVSSVTPSCDSVYFPSLSSCLAKLPEVINAPYLIEVGSFGNLGTLTLSNKTFGPRGSIEIINRNFGKGEPATYTGICYNIENARVDNAYSLASSIGPVNATQLFFVDLIVTPTVLSDLAGSRVYSNNQLVFSSNAVLDQRLVNNLTLFTRKLSADDNQRMTASLAARNSTASAWTVVPGTSHRVSFTPYELNAESTDLINSYDASCINEISNAEIIWKNNLATEDEPATVLAYGNKLEGIKVYNCNGPIVIRNFTVDGSGYGGRDYGIDIRNSSVHLEEMSVARCNKAGLYATNSRVTITKGFVSYRNYGFNPSGVRNGIPWNNKIGVVNSVNTQNDMGAGIYLSDSELNFSSVYNQSVSSSRLHLSSIYPDWYGIVLDTPTVPSFGWLTCLARNDIGLHAVNSRIYGGRTELSGISLNAHFDAHQIISELNTEAGIRLENSTLDHSGRLFFYGNFRGLHGINSKIDSDTLVAKFNQKEGCFLENSRLKYNRNLYPTALRSNQSLAQTFGVHQNMYFLNGTHLKLNNSTYEPYEVFGLSGTPNYHERFVASGNFGVTQNISNQRSILPAIIVDNSSKLVAVHPGIVNQDSFVDDKAVLFGAAISVTDGSEVVLKGSKDFVTKIIGPSTFTQQKRKAGLYANNNSVIKLQGPTVIARYGVDALVDNNSKLEITPHSTPDGSLAVSSYSLLDKGNHTIVELHSTRSCLVANNNSEILMKNLGDYTTRWASGTIGANSIASGLDYLTNQATELNTALYTSGGSIQFYPNPNDSAYYPPAKADPTISLYASLAMSQNARGDYYFFEDGIGDVAQQQDFSGITHGGMCLRALNGSKVKVDNVHFPCGWWVPSGIIYDIHGADSVSACNRLFIWNIADNSQLEAKYISVSGLHPADVGYFGPSGTWNNASAMHPATPDTGSASILDFYGRSTNHIYSRLTAANQGPFRLYFSTDPLTNWLVTSSLTLSGFVPQVFAQGYNFSAALVAVGNLSSLYMGALRFGPGLSPSGYFYASSMVHSPRTIKAVLDESAANTFANAKHNSVGKDSMAKLVSILLPYTGQFGGDSAQSSVKGLGRGLRSVNTFDLEKDN